MPTTYTVTRQEPDSYDFTVPGNPVLGTIVYFTTGDGNTGSVFIPATQYNVRNVRAAVEARAKLIDEIGTIAGTAI